MANKFNIKGKIDAFQRAKKTLAPIVANQAKNFFIDNFKKQGFDDDNFKKWERRRTPRRRDVGRAILVQSGDLRRSIRVKDARPERIVIGSYMVPYARVHNEGLNGMPKRQFMGKSRKLQKQMKETIIKQVNRAL